MSARSKARKRALDVLFASEMRGTSAVEALTGGVADEDGPTNPYTAVLVKGVMAELDPIDDLISAYSQGWSLDRMPAVDRNVLRIAVWEMLHGGDDVPAAVAISEAATLVGELSTDDSPKFVNGLLDALRRGENLG